MKKILSATYVDYMSDPRAYKINEGLTNEYIVDVLSFRRSCENIPHTSANVINNKYYFSNVFLNLSLFWLDFIIHAIRGKYDIIVAHNYYLVLPLWVISHLTKKKTVYDSYELYVPTKKTNLDLRQSFFYFIEKIAIRKFDLVIAANEERARLMKAKFGLKKRPLTILNISTSFDSDDSLKITEKYPEINNINGRMILVYQGFLGAGRDCSVFLKILKQLPSNYALLIIGGGPDLNYLKQLSKDIDIEDRIVFTGNIPMKDVHPLLKLCNFGLVSYPFSDLNNIYCSPNKIYEYPAAGLPMICSSQHSITRILRPYNIACFVDFMNIPETVSKIIKFTTDNSDFKIKLEKFLLDNSWEIELNKLLLKIYQL